MQDEVFSRNLRKAYEESGIKREVFAHDVGITLSTACRYLSGSRLPNVYVATKIAERLGTTVERLCSE